MAIKHQLKRLALALPGFQALCRRATRRHVRVLMYHRFSADGSDHPRRLPVRTFARHLDYLARHHRVWTPDQQFAADAAALDAGAPPVVLTVDDGYADFAGLAAPLLARHGMPAMVFVTTGFVAGETWFWWDRLYWLLEHCPAGTRTFRFADREASGDPSAEGQRWRLWHAIADHLSVIDDERKEAALADLAGQTGMAIPVSAPADFAAMDWDTLRGLAASGIVFGAHTDTHPVLSRVPPERAEDEIARSRERLQAELGTAPGWFCYPQGGPGDFGPETVAAVRRCGFRAAYAAHPDSHRTVDDDDRPFTFPRYSAAPDRTTFEWTLCGAEYLLRRLTGGAATPEESRE